MKKLAALLFFTCLWACCVEAKAQQPEEVHYYPPIYYKETPFGYEMLEELPRDTVVIRDTVYISDMDGFLARHFAGGADIYQAAGKVAAIEQALDSLSGLSDQAIFYNFFQKNDSLHKIADNFIVREFYVDSELNTGLLRSNVTEDKGTASLRREILFRCDGTEHTDRFIKNKDAILQCLSYLFTQMQEDTLGIEGINLYFPDYDFRSTRSMIQFVKSARILMDASRDFKFGTARLTVILHKPADIEPNYIKKTRYGLKQEASEVVFVDGNDIENNIYVAGEVSSEDMDDTELLQKIASHLYIARYYTGNTDIRQCALTDFSQNSIKKVIWIDYPENNWETYMLVIILISIALAILVLLYHTHLMFSTLVASHTESVLLVLIVVALEIGILLLTAFQNMCKEDSFTMIERHPVIIFLLPIIVILIAPLLHMLIKNKRLP